ncbi:hypothetical protein AB0L71_10180 [Streptomyces sp. NPDC052052]|uniref:hypothetical protein n=1 Tax=Streptomyces sp. NPDC052052 TaxID=3154756 RepID=UPI0034316736
MSALFLGTFFLNGLALATNYRGYAAYILNTHMNPAFFTSRHLRRLRRHGKEQPMLEFHTDTPYRLRNLRIMGGLHAAFGFSGLVAIAVTLTIRA